jgi:hypothetical protein
MLEIPSSSVVFEFIAAIRHQQCESMLCGGYAIWMKRLTANKLHIANFSVN